jgi:hypothetical protein
METNISEVLKTAIELDELLIEKYLLEQQKKSTDSYQIFFGRLKSKIKKLYREPADHLLLNFDNELLEWFFEVGLFDRSIWNKLASSKSYMRMNLPHLEKLISQFKLVKNIVNRLSEQSFLEPETTATVERNQSSPEIQLINNFNSMEMKDVIAHFRPLVRKKNNDKSLWMTEEDFNLFLKRSFSQEEGLPKPKIKVGNTGKYAVVSLFYQFYQKCLSEDISKNNKKEPFIRLLKDAFDTTKFNKIIPSNFKIKGKYNWW